MGKRKSQRNPLSTPVSKKAHMSDAEVQTKVLIPTVVAKNFIGKNGEEIDKLARDSDCFLQMSKNQELYHNTKERICRVKGKIPSCMMVIEAIRNVIKRNAKHVSTDLYDLKEMDRNNEIKLVVHNTSDDMVIGDNIKKIRKTTGAIIQVKPQVAKNYEDFPERVITVGSDNDKVVFDAILKIFELIVAPCFAIDNDQKNLIINEGVKSNNKPKEISVYFQLLGLDDELCGEKSLVVDKDEGVQELFLRISKVFDINLDYTNFYWDKKLLAKGTLDENGIKSDCTIDVRHLKTETYKHFLHLYQLLQSSRIKAEHIIMDVIKEAYQFIKILEKSMFETTFPKYATTIRTFKLDFSRHLDTKSEYIEAAAIKYFSHLFGNTEGCPLEFDFLPKSYPGAQGGSRCFVKRSHKLLGSYYLKTHFALTKTSSGDASVDMRELFMYVLLHKLGLGPQVHFIANQHGSKYGLYIGTEEVPGFKTASEKPLSRDDQIKLSLICDIFFLHDLQENNSNCGYGKNNRLAIIDFQIAPVCSRQSSIRSTMSSSSVAEQFLHFLKVGKKISEAEQEIRKQILLLSEQNIAFNSRKKFKTFIKHIRDNVTFVGELKKKNIR